MTYPFPTDIRQRLEARLAIGMYANEDEVIREAMDALDEVEQRRQRRWAELNEVSIAQSEQGLSKPLSDEAVLTRLRDRLGQEGTPD